MNELYYIKISELPVINSRSQKEFDDILLEYIEKFKKITTNKDTISHLIATSIDYPVQYIRELINTYIRSNLLTNNLDRIKNKEFFVREKLIVKSFETLHFIYDRKKEVLQELEQIHIKEYEEKKGNKVELDDKDYLNVFKQLFYNDNFYDKNTKEKDKYLMSLTIKKIEKNKYKDFFKDKIEFYTLDTITPTQKEKIKKYKKNNYRFKLSLYKEKYNFLNIINDKNCKGYYEYNLASSKSKDSNICDETIKELLSIAKESIFIITTKVDNNLIIKTKSYKKIEKLKNDQKKYIRTIEGFNNKDKVTIKVDREKDNYSLIFNNMIHSKIIVVDDFFVALGSGNWFSNNREKYEDSLVIFPCENAIKKYCPIYYPKSDYYKIFEQLINEREELLELLDLYLMMKKDLIYDLSKSKNVYDEILIKKIEKSMEDNIDKEFDNIIDFLKREKENRFEFINYLLSSEKIEKKHKEVLKTIYSNGGDN